MEEERLSVRFRVNGRECHVEVQPYHTLLYVLQQQLNLTGAKEACGEGECGACTILLNGRAVNSCLILAAEAEGADIGTVEGLANGQQLSPLQQAFISCGAVQCGYCTPGMLMAAEYLLANNLHPTTEEVKEALSGNLCRCTGYSRIVKAVCLVADGQVKCEDEAEYGHPVRKNGRTVHDLNFSS